MKLETIDLGVANDWEERLPNTNFNSFKVVYQTGSAKIKFNKRDTEIYDLDQVIGIKDLGFEVEKYYLKNTKQTGDILVIAFGRDLELDTARQYDNVTITETPAVKPEDLDDIETKLDTILNEGIKQSGSNVSDNVNELTVSNLSAGATEDILVQPNENTYKKLITFAYYFTWSEATTGNVEIKIYKGTSASIKNQFLQLSSTYTNNKIEVRPYYLRQTTIDFPSYFAVNNEWSSEFINYIQSFISYSNDNPLTIQIRNNLDVGITFNHFNLFEEVRG